MARWQSPIVLAAVAVGLVLALATDAGAQMETLVLPSLIGLMALTFCTISPARVVSAISVGRRTATVALGLNFVWAPGCAAVLGWLLLSGNLDLRIGLVMLLVTPCTDWYLVFTSLAGGNVPLAAALLPVNLVLQLLLLPVLVVLLTGQDGSIPLTELLVSVVVVLGVPIAVAAAVRTVARVAGAAAGLERNLVRLEPVGLGLLGLAVMGIFAAHGQVAADEAGTLGPLLVALVVFFAATYGLANATASLSGLAKADRITLTMTTMARNSPVGLAVAVAAFPDRPLVAVALVVGALVELPVLSMVTRLERFRDVSLRARSGRR